MLLCLKKHLRLLTRKGRDKALLERYQVECLGELGKTGWLPEEKAYEAWTRGLITVAFSTMLVFRRETYLAVHPALLESTDSSAVIKAAYRHWYHLEIPDSVWCSFQWSGNLDAIRRYVRRRHEAEIIEQQTRKEMEGIYEIAP